ncbi:ComEC/Rec2 family competence protein [Nocardioides sp. LML1-1-1.1]|uniref:ComEC/Rec2 family competence protein n=1 Tax=Nocardioides sp. LML1-1-1.1 TaxID=3135248 RepID=UPI003431B4A0
MAVPSPAPRHPPRHDLRAPALGVAAWLAGIAAARLPARGSGLLAGLLLLAAVLLATRRSRLLLAAALVAGAVLVGALLRHEAMTTSPLHEHAARRTSARLVATVVSDPRRVEGSWGDRVVVRLRARELTARGERRELGGTVVVLGDPAWARVALGEVVRAQGRLARADGDDVAAVLLASRAPVRIRGPDPWWRASGALRASIRTAVADRPPDQAGLVPALVDGDESALPQDLEADFRTTGLTHLTAVSGTNLTLVVGALLLLARAAGVRGRWLALVGAVGIAGFVLLARTEPSVLRAAAMGTVGLFAFGPDGRRRGLRALGVALVTLVLLDPGLATSAGFALSVLATAGIVLLGPPFSDALARWLPRLVAEAVAVPTAAQLACTPVIAVLSEQVSLVAVLANLLAGPLVGPATVLGLLAGLVGLVAPGPAALVGTTAGWCVAWIVTVAQHGAALPGAAVGWGSGWCAVVLLVLLCAGVALALPRVLRHRGLAVALGVVLVAVLLGIPGRLVPRGHGAWPPPGWLLVACDVGQGDALVLAAAPGAAVVVDAGPDPDAVDECLGRLGVVQVPLLVLTHFHADHVDGLPGVLRGRRVAVIETSPVLDPPGGVADVRRAAQEAGVPVRTAPYGSVRRVGAATLQVVHPDLPEQPGAGDGSSANDASVVLAVDAGGVRMLLTGDVEPTVQARLARLLPGLDVDVLKVPHHGSRHQDERWLTSLRAEVALVSVGADNDYGHPDGPLLARLTAAGAEVHRTDEEGDLAVVRRPDGGLATATRR